MDFIIELSDDTDVEKEVIDKVHFQDLIITTLTDLEKAVICLQISGEYLEQDVSAIIGLSHTSVWTISRGAKEKLLLVVDEDDLP